MTAKRRTVWRSTALFAAFAAASAGVVLARQTTHAGTITDVAKGRVQVRAAAEAGKPAPKPEWFTLLPTTRVIRGEAEVSNAQAALKKGDRASIVVAPGDEAGTEWTCIMHPEVAQPAAGSCPTCRMALTTRVRPAKASEIRLQTAR